MLYIVLKILHIMPYLLQKSDVIISTNMCFDAHFETLLLLFLFFLCYI